MQRITLKLTAAALCAAAVPSVRAAESAKGGKVTPVLPPDAKVARLLASLGPGQSVLLPPVKTTGDLNATAKKYRLDKKGPGGRDYCTQMVWMSDRKRAIFTGANHGVPHRLNDVWEYDLSSNTWGCLYGPDDLGKSGKVWGGVWKKVTLKDGVLRTARGGPAIMGHQWWQSTYDPTTGTMYFNSQWPAGYFSAEIKEKYIKSGKHTLWSFKPATGKWEPVKTKKPAPKPGVPMNKYFEYVPELKGCVFVDASGYAAGTWLFDPADKSWKELLPGPAKDKVAGKNPDLPHRLGVMAYCPGKGLLVGATVSVKGVGRTVHYDIAGNKWTQTATGTDTPAAHVAFTPCGYDPVSGCLLLWEPEHRFQKKGKRNALWAYSVNAKKWNKIVPRGPLPPKGKPIGYFDPERNVFVVYSSGPKSAQVWIYRHKKRTK